jgi:DeoR/GlpR family transcriptional regulator of sugar metabolism
MSKKNSGTPEERREHVWRFMTRRLSVEVMSELLGVSKQTIFADMKAIKEQWIERAAVVSDAAIQAHEEIEALLSIAASLSMEMETISNGKEKAKLGAAAGHLLYLAGRLKQGGPAWSITLGPGEQTSE